MSAITINQEKCNQDGVCVSECPSRVLQMDTPRNCPTPAPDFDTYCIQCGHCVAVCPTQAFSLEWLKPEDCWAGYLYSAINTHRPLFEALELPEEHKAFGAVMIGYPKFRYRRVPVRNNPRVVWK